MKSTGTVRLGDGTKIKYRLDGPLGAPLLTLSNSIATTLHMWDRNILELSATFRVLRYDTRGHGDSSAPEGAYSIERLGRDVIELLDALGIDRTNFCGISLGGLIGQWLAIHAPDRVERLVLANTSAYLGPAPYWDTRIAEALTAHDLDDIARSFLQNWFPPALLEDRSLIGQFHADIVNTRANGLAGCLAAVRDVDLRRTASLIEAPTLVIIGENDSVCLPSHGEELAEIIHGARAVRLPVTHLTNIEDPVRFHGILTRFFASNESLPVGSQDQSIASARD